MTAVRDHTELDAWKLSDTLRSLVDGIVAHPSFLRHPKLRRQLIDAAAGPCPNIAEGFSRYYPSENAPFVRIAKASLTETIEHLHRARSLKLVDAGRCDEAVTIARRARGAVTRYLIYLESADVPREPRRRGGG